MVNMLGYLAYVLICSTGVIQGTSMILGRNFRYSIWSAISIEAGLVLLQVSLYFSGGAPTYVIVGNAVSVVANGVCLAYMLRPLLSGCHVVNGCEVRADYCLTHDCSADNQCSTAECPHCITEPSVETSGGNTFAGPSANAIMIPPPEHDHPPYGLREGVPYWEYANGCPACGRTLFDETQMREI